MSLNKLPENLPPLPESKSAPSFQERDNVRKASVSVNSHIHPNDCTCCINPTLSIMQKIVQPCDIDALTGGLSIGILLKWMDAIACLSAEKLSNAPSVTVSMDDLHLECAVPPVTSLVTLKAYVSRAFRTSMEVEVPVFMENLQDPSAKKVKVCSAYFTFVSLDENKKRVLLPQFVPKRACDKLDFDMAFERRNIRLQRRKEIDHISKRIEKSVSKRADSSILYKPPSSSEIQEKNMICVTETRTETVEILFSHHTQHHGTAFGGQLMEWAMTIAFITASRVCIPEFQSVDDVFFTEPSVQGDRIYLFAQINRAFETSLEIGVRMEAQAITGERRHITSLFFTFGIIKPLRTVTYNTPEDVVRYHEAGARRKIRLDRSVIRSREGIAVYQPDSVEFLLLDNVSKSIELASTNSRWENFFSDGAISIFTNENGGKLNLQILCDFEAPSAFVNDILSESVLRPYWDPIYSDSVILKQISETDFILCQRLRATEQTNAQELILLQSKRQNIFEGDDNFLNAFCSLDFKDYPENDNYIRAVIQSLSFIITATPNGHSQLCYTSSGITSSIMSYYLNDLIGASSYIMKTFASILQFFEIFQTDSKYQAVKQKIKKDIDEAKATLTSSSNSILELGKKVLIFNQCRLQSKKRALEVLQTLHDKYAKSNYSWSALNHKAIHDIIANIRRRTQEFVLDEQKAHSPRTARTFSAATHSQTPTPETLSPLLSPFTSKK